MDDTIISEAHVTLINQLLNTPVGLAESYRLGCASGLALQAGVEPTRGYFEHAMNAESLQECVRFCVEWVKREGPLAEGSK